MQAVTLYSTCSILVKINYTSVLAKLNTEIRSYHFDLLLIYSKKFYSVFCWPFIYLISFGLPSKDPLYFKSFTKLQGILFPDHI